MAYTVTDWKTVENFDFSLDENTLMSQVENNHQDSKRQIVSIHHIGDDFGEEFL